MKLDRIVVDPNVCQGQPTDVKLVCDLHIAPATVQHLRALG